MKTCLIRPPILVPNQNPIVQFTPPLGLAYIAGALKAEGFALQVIDGLGEALDLRHPADNECHLYGLHPDDIVARIDSDCDVIGISAAFTFEWPTCRDLINLIRQRFPEAVIIGGGEHATALPKLSLSESALDMIILGEGEETMVEVVRTLENGADFAQVPGIVFKDQSGQIVFNERRGRIRQIDTIPWPAWDMLPIEEYLHREMGFGVNRGRSMPVLASRGCPYQCTFCSSPQMWTTRWVSRDPDDLLDELEFYQNKYHIQNFDFYDLTAIVKKAWIVEFCKKIEQRKLKFTWQLPSGTRTEAIDHEVARLLYQSGCRNLSYAPESGSLSVLSRIKKRIRPQSMIESMKGSVVAGLNVKCNLMMGFPGENAGEILESFRFIVKMAWVGAHDLSIWAFSPYPGSELFEQLSAENKIHLDENYYDALRSYSDTSRTRSFSENISSRNLKLLRWVGTALFYLVGWARRPWRPFLIIYNVCRGVSESRGELALSTMLRRFRMVEGSSIHRAAGSNIRSPETVHKRAV